MGWVSQLASFLSSLGPDNIDVTIGGDDIDIERVDEDATVAVKSGRAEHKAVVTEECILLYPDTFQGNEYARFQEVVESAKREEGRIQSEDEVDDTRAIESVAAGGIGETVSFFEALLSSRHLSLLRSSLYLREVSEHRSTDASFRVNEEKRDLKDRYGYEAYYFYHLVSSGYFDEGRFFRDLYHEISSEGGPTEERYRDEIETIIGEKLIATFVSSDDTVHGVLSDIKAGVMKQYRFQPRVDFFDVCGVGGRCEEMIDSAIDELDGQYSGLEYEEMDRGMECVVRLFPGSLQDFDVRS